MRQKGSHVTPYSFDADRTIVVPLHSRDLPRWLLKKIIKDAGLDQDRFRALL